MFTTPVLLITWRRPHCTSEVLEKLQIVKPAKLYISSDGASSERDGEADKVNTTRKVIADMINWNCEVHRLYSEVNQGCKIGVSRAISWFFENEEEGIILEDDCVPHQDFFEYCAILLSRFRDDERIWCISGSNFQDNQWRGDGSYYFSRYSHIWGWASWRRCWKHYDPDIKYFAMLKSLDFYQAMFEDPIEQLNWMKTFEQLFEHNEPDTWDYQWFLTCLTNAGLSVLPNRNLVSNIGFGKDATHTTQVMPPNDADVGILPIKHPTFLLRDAIADRYTFDHIFNGIAKRNADKTSKSRMLRFLRKCKRLVFKPTKFICQGQ